MWKVKINGGHLITLMLAGFLSVSGQAETTDNGVFSWSTVYLTGKMDGFLQTPDGGMPGRTDRHRPSFEELDIDSTDNIELTFNLNKGPANYYLTATPINFKESLTLDSSLLSQWIQFDAGDQIKADIKMSQYRFGYQYSFTSDSIADFSYSLSGDIALFDFHYQLDSYDKHVNRSYMKAGYRIGMTLDYSFSEQSSMELKLYNSLPFPNTVEVRTLDLSGHYVLWKKKNIVSLIFGVSYHRIDYQDEQEVPNHIVAEMGPMIRLGFTLTMGQ